MNNPHARQRILDRLRRAGYPAAPAARAPLPPDIALDREEKVRRLATRMTAVRADVHRVAEAGWPARLRELAREKGWQGLVYGPGSPMGKQIEDAWSTDSENLPALLPYGGPVETFKDALFDIDAGITTARGAVADSGALVLWPTTAEPRLLSLVPPVHVAVLRAETIYNSLTEMIAAENWPRAMPTNALLISGPSKTADIEFNLVFGVHGPKELILLIVD